MGVGPRPNCPDRSWCVAPWPGMRSSGDTGRSYSRNELREKHRHRRGKELLGSGISDPSLEPARRDYWLVGLIAARTSPLHSVALRVTITSLKKSYSNTSLPVDNPHRGSGDWLGHGIVISQKSLKRLLPCLQVNELLLSANPALKNLVVRKAIKELPVVLVRRTPHD